jgi:CRP-like cAMP-binding protein
MAPKAMSFKANSVIYFRGDASDKVFILKAGKVALDSFDIETGEPLRDLIQTGEFFGVKSALGKYPREEDARALGETHVLYFSVPEFEKYVSQNIRLTMKMMQVFSSQLRKLHKRITGRFDVKEKTDPEAGLFSVGQHYLKKGDASHALHVFKRYRELYPSGRFAEEAAGAAEKVEMGYSSPNLAKKTDANA